MPKYSLASGIEPHSVKVLFAFERTIKQMLINPWADFGLFRFQEQYTELMLAHALNNFFDRVEWIKEIICEFTKYILKPLVF